MVTVANSTKCSGCMLCCLACSFNNTPKREFNPSKSMIKVTEKSDGSFSVAVTEECMQCDTCVDYCHFGVLARQQEVGHG